MIVAVIGSRDFTSRRLMESWLEFHLPKGCTVISGGARGPDTWGIEIARSLGHWTEVYEADWERNGRGAGLKRNTVLATEADWVIAFWDKKSRGTRDTIIKAHELGKVVTVVFPDGTYRHNKDDDEVERHLRDAFSRVQQTKVRKGVAS